MWAEKLGVQGYHSVYLGRLTTYVWTHDALCLEGAGEEQTVLPTHLGHCLGDGELERLLVGARPWYFLHTK